MKPAESPEAQSQPVRKPWNEVFDESGRPRAPFKPLVERLGKLRPSDLRLLDERMQATMREMGLTFGAVHDKALAEEPWFCDVLPHVFSPSEWEHIERGLVQRIRAFDLFLQDIYTHKHILRSDVIPLRPVLGSPFFLSGATGLKPVDGAYLHLCGLCICRDPDGQFVVKSHHFGLPTGISYMMQNRRVLARVAPESFTLGAVESIAETPLALLEKLRSLSLRGDAEVNVVLLSPGTSSPVYSEHSFLARRMGIRLVQGGDLLVLDNCVYVKTIAGLERVDVIYRRMSDEWIDPIVFNRSSRIGVPGLVNCLRKGTVSLINCIGSQLADDRTMLCFGPRIIRFYLNEKPILPTLPTFWLGDIDQREMVLENPGAHWIRPLYGERILGPTTDREPTPQEEAAVRQEMRRNPDLWVAQPRITGARTVCYSDGKQVERMQDHIVFALRKNGGYDVFPGALTRVSSTGSPFTAAELGGGSKDTWVVSHSAEPRPAQHHVRRLHELTPSPRQVTSRVAEAFYWMGRYLERAHSMAYMVQVVETLEMEELNSAERKLYRPMWNRLLPPLEAEGERRHSIASRFERYRLIAQMDEPDSIGRILLRAIWNAESTQECLSPEAWSVLANLRQQFQNVKFKSDAGDTEYSRVARKLSASATRLIPQFFGTAQMTMLEDDGWRFCELAQHLERAINTANAVVSIRKSLQTQLERPQDLEHATEIELSAFLRMLGTRDAYRRVYQMRAEPLAVLEILWRNHEAPHSVLHCMTKCARLLRQSAPADAIGTARALSAIETLLHKLKRIDWQSFDFSQQPAHEGKLIQPALLPGAEEPPGRESLFSLLSDLMTMTLEVHHAISDGFLNHQAQLSPTPQPFLSGF